ncbi:glycosyltransferase [Limnohabitans radicicola]|uniref:Glycosyltransferase n=1 Tax=Limnohabitans radicicola TaxID=2771427 RepID=A0A927FES1_9BURK|nr:glycosyltransferase [Limnohabitans radicicola]MBD8049726.1 glycosyltransferase [Limnohabitans radicicola]
MLHSLIKRIYYWLPLSPGMRYRLGQHKKQVLRLLKGPGAGRGLDVLSIPQVSSTQESSLDTLTVHAERWHQPASAGKRDYVFFGVIDWHFRHQRPQQLAQSIAQEGHRVFYVSVNFIDSQEAGFQIEQLHDNLPLYQVFFNLPGPHSVYAGAPDADTLQRLREGQRALWQQCAIRRAVHVVQHPYWFGLASFVAPARLVYDCMDFHAGFSNTGASHESVELQLLKLADLTIVTSDFLVDFARKAGAKKVALIRNAGEFDHFHQAATDQIRKAQAPVIGYYGAIAEWFDPALIEAISRKFPQAKIELIGDDSAKIQAQLQHCANVRFHGEKKYTELPGWLARFDVCLIPFKINQLTLATNPVKVYEYLSAGKPVVGSDLPELAQFGDLVYRASDVDGFVRAVDQALSESREDAKALHARRIDFARGQTWNQRAQALLAATEDACLEPLTSVVVISYNQWHLTERCLQSIADHSDTESLEVIVIDNASADETPQRLQIWADQDPAHRKIVLNSDNRGFGPAVNQGLALSQGEYLVILNNDIIVGPGWLRGLRRHLEVRPELGLLCPVTNNIGNEAQVALLGSNPAEVFESARHYNLGRAGKLLPLTIAAFFCVMMPRHVYSRVGGLDEQFVPGFFEDDDYCLRVKALGLTIGCAEDVFVYHELSASFDKLSVTRRQAVFERNKALFEQKWGTWKPHVYRAESLH